MTNIKNKTFSKVAILFFTYDRLEYTKLALKALLENTEYPFELHIVDNASKDGTVDFLKDLELLYPETIRSIIFNKENLGLAGPTNDFWNRVDADYYGKVDNDTVVPKGWLQKLIMAHEKIPELAVVSAYHFPVDEVDMEVISKKIITKDGISILTDTHVGGCAYLIKKSIKNMAGLMKVDPSKKIHGWTEYQNRLNKMGYIIGYFYPLIALDYLDDPRNENCLIDSHYMDYSKEIWRERGIDLKDVNQIKTWLIKDNERIAGKAKIKKLNKLIITNKLDNNEINKILGNDTKNYIAIIISNLIEYKTSDPNIIFISDIDSFDFNNLSMKFDEINIENIFEKTTNRDSFLQNCKGVLNADGIVNASIFNIQNHKVLKDLSNGNWEYDSNSILDKEHIYFYTKSEIDNYFKKNGLEIIEYKEAGNNFDIKSYNKFFKKNSTSNLEFGKLSILNYSKENAKEFFYEKYNFKARIKENFFFNKEFDDGKYFIHERKDVAAVVSEKAMKILDVGCAAGGLIKTLKNQNPIRTVIGIELNEEAAKVASQFADDIIVANVENYIFNFENKDFDCIVFADILEHLKEPERVLNKFKKYLKSDGELIVSIPNINNYEILENLVNGKWEYKNAGILDKTHLRFFTKASFKKVLNANGFSIEKLKRIHTGIEKQLLNEWKKVKNIQAFDYKNVRFNNYTEDNVLDLFTEQYIFKCKHSQKKPLISIIIPVYNQIKYTLACIESIVKETSSPYEIIVVNNGSQDDTINSINSLKNSNVKLISVNINKGFGPACNLGISKAKGEYIVLLNNDTIVTKNWISKFLSSFNNDPKLGITAPVSNYVGDYNQFTGPTEYSNYNGMVNFSNSLEVNYRDQVTYTDRVIFLCVMIKKELIDEIGIFDENFKIGNYEDDDFCYRAVRNNWKINVRKDTFIHHFGSKTFSSHEAELNHTERMIFNGNYFFKKWNLDRKLYTSKIKRPKVSDLVESNLEKFFDQKKSLKQQNKDAKKIALNGDTDKAIFLFEEIVKKDPLSFDSNFNLGVLYTSKKEILKAINCYLNCYKIKSNDKNIIINLSYLLLEIDKRFDALAIIDEYILNYPYDTEMQNLRNHIGNPNRDIAQEIDSIKKISKITTQPLVSIIMPTYNRLNMLKRAINSILKQTYTNFEIIVINDAGEDVSRVIEELNQEGKIKLLNNDINKKMSKTRNWGLRESKGEYIAYLDDDDMYLPDHIEKLVKFSISNNFDVVYANSYKVFCETGNYETFSETDDNGLDIYKRAPSYQKEYNYNNLIVSNQFPILSILHKKEVLDKCGYFDETLDDHEDWELWIRIAKQYNFNHLDEFTSKVTWMFNSSTITSNYKRNYTKSYIKIYNKYNEEQIKNPKIFFKRKKILKSLAKKEGRIIDIDKVLNFNKAGENQKDLENNLEESEKSVHDLIQDIKKEVSIIIPVWNKVDLTKQCLDNLFKNTRYSNYEIIIIDNNSTDSTAKYLDNIKEKNVYHIRNKENLGFAKASNQGARAANGRYLVFLNNDTIPQKGWLTNLVKTIQSSKKIGIVGSKLFYPDDTIQHCGASMRYDNKFFRHQYKYLHKNHPLVNYKRKLDAVTAACFITPKSLFYNLNYFDEKYLNGCEDMDYCTSVRENGYEIIYEPKSELYHLESQTPRMSNKDQDNFNRYLHKWRSEKMKNEIEVYSEDGFWIKKENVFEQRSNQLLQTWLAKLEEAKNQNNQKNITKYTKIIGRIYPVKTWGKSNKGTQKRQLKNHQTKKMKILFVAHDFPPYRFAGAQLYARNLAQKINQLGLADVDILHPVFRNVKPEQYFQIHRNDKFGLRIFELFKPVVGEPQKVYDDNIYEIVFKFLKENKYDVIHFHGLGQISLAPVFAAKNLNIPTIMTFHDYWFLCDRWHMIRENQNICNGPESIKKCGNCYLQDNHLESNLTNISNIIKYKKYRKEMMSKAFNLIDKKISPSKYLANVFEKWGFPEIDVDPLGFEYKEIPDKNNDYKISKKIIFGFSGQIIVRKGINFLIEAFKLIPNENIELHIWGKLNHKSKFVQYLLKETSTDERIKIKGEYKPEELKKIYKTFDIAVIPSLMENYPLVVQEAFIYKTPVISTNAGGIPEVVINNSNGLLIEAGSSESIKNAMEKTIANPNLIIKFTKNIKPVKKLSEDAEIYSKYYETLNKGNRRISKKYSIQFYVYKNVHWAMFEELYNYLSRRDEVEKIYICLPAVNQIIVNNNYSLVEKILKLDAEIVAKPIRNVDVTFIADTIAGKVSGCGKIVNIGHGTISKGYYFTDSVWTERENWVDLLCVPGDYAKEQFNKILHTKVVATGMPKLDPVFRGEFSRDNLCRILNLKKDKKIILYAPTFNIDLSSVFDFSENFSELGSSEYYLLIKLHGSTLPYLVEKYKNFAEQNENIIFIEDANIALYLGGADLMISDVSSAFMEFMALNKPVILYNNKNMSNYHGFNLENIEYKWRDLGYEVSTIYEIKNKIKDIFQNDKKSEIRIKYAKQLFADLEGNACEKVWLAAKNILHQPIVKRMNILSIGLILGEDNLFSVRQIIREIQFYSVIPIDLILIVKESSKRIEEFLEYLTYFNQFRHLRIIHNQDTFENSIIKMINSAESDYFLFLNEDVSIYKNFGYMLLKTFMNNPTINAVTGVTDIQGCQNSKLFIDKLDGETPDKKAYAFINKFRGKAVYSFTDNDLPKLWCIKLGKNKFRDFSGLKEFLLNEIAISPSIYYSTINDEDFETLKKIMRYKNKISEDEFVKTLADIFKIYQYPDFAEMLLETLSKKNSVSYDDKIYLSRLSLIGRFYDYFLKKRLMKILSSKLILHDLTKELEIMSALKMGLSNKENKLKGKIIKNRKSKKFLFYFFKNVHIPILIPIYEKLKELHPDVEIAFSYLKPAPQIRAGLSLGELDLIKKYNVPIYDTPQEFQPDLTFIADSVYPWVKNCGKLVHVGHGILSKGQYYTDTEIARREEHADLICVPGKYHKNVMKKIISKPVIATGMAKLDKLFSGELTKVKVLGKYGLPKDYRYILYAPTFNDELSSIPFVGDKIYEIVPDDKTFLIIKLHGSTNSKYKKMFSEMPKSYPNVIYVDDEEIDITPFLIISDIMISDVSSAMIEYAALDKPLILFNNPNWGKYKNYNPNDIEYNVRDMAIETSSIQEIKRAIKIYTIDKNIKSDLRQKYTDLLLENKNDGKAAEKIINETFKIFG